MSDDVLSPLKRVPRTHLVIYSGGMDSYTLLNFVHRRCVDLSFGDALIVLSFDYGQRHSRELAAARKVTNKLGLRHHVLELRFMHGMRGESALTNRRVPVPHGHYAAENMKQTVVPGRNTIMLSIALGMAEAAHPTRAATVYYGAHSGDHAIYPDCRPDFFDAMGNTMLAASDQRVQLSAPFLFNTKGDILVVGKQLMEAGVELDYGDTWTCYEGGEYPCGKCGACVERAEAFEFAQMTDPLIASLPPALKQMR